MVCIITLLTLPTNILQCYQSLWVHFLISATNISYDLISARFTMYVLTTSTNKHFLQNVGSYNKSYPSHASRNKKSKIYSRYQAYWALMKFV